MEPQRILVKNIRGFRKALKVTQEKVAGKMKMSPNHYARIERGEDGLNLKTRSAPLCKIFGISFDQLLVPDAY